MDPKKPSVAAWLRCCSEPEDPEQTPLQHPPGGDWKSGHHTVDHDGPQSGPGTALFRARENSVQAGCTRYSVPGAGICTDDHRPTASMTLVCRSCRAPCHAGAATAQHLPPGALALGKPPMLTRQCRVPYVPRSSAHLR